MQMEDEAFYNYSDDVLNGSAIPAEALCEPFSVLLGIFNTYYYPFIILLGLLGNLLSCVVFLTTHLRMRSSSYYLAALAVSDFGFLVVLLVVYLGNHFDHLNVFNRHGWCEFMVYSSSVCGALSVWLIVAFTVERFIAVQYPLQRPHICTVSRAKSVVAAIVCVAMLLESYCFVTSGILEHNGQAECEMLRDYRGVMNIINAVDTLITLIGPVILIVVMNTMIARNLLMFRRRFQIGSLDECLQNKEYWKLTPTQTQTGSSNRRHGSVQSRPNSSKIVRIAKASHSEPLACIHARPSSRSIVSSRNQQNITKMLLVISSVFIVLNLPSYAIRLYLFFAYTLWQRQPPEYLWCMQQFAMMLYYSNFSINFLLYAMSGVTFRQCLWQLLSKNLKLLTRRPCTPQRCSSNGDCQLAGESAATSNTSILSASLNEFVNIEHTEQYSFTQKSDLLVQN